MLPLHLPSSLKSLRASKRVKHFDQINPKGNFLLGLFSFGEET